MMFADLLKAKESETGLSYASISEYLPDPFTNFREYGYFTGS